MCNFNMEYLDYSGLLKYDNNIKDYINNKIPEIKIISNDEINSIFPNIWKLSFNNMTIPCKYKICRYSTGYPAYADYYTVDILYILNDILLLANEISFVYIELDNFKDQNYLYKIILYSDNNYSPTPIIYTGNIYIKLNNINLEKLKDNWSGDFEPAFSNYIRITLVDNLDDVKSDNILDDNYSITLNGTIEIDLDNIIYGEAMA